MCLHERAVVLRFPVVEISLFPRPPAQVNKSDVKLGDGAGSAA